MVKLGSLIGSGQTAEVYEADSGWVVKLFFEWVPDEWVTYEAKISSAVASRVRKVPRVGKITDIGKRKGIMYSKVEGTSLLEVLKLKPWTASSIGKKIARLHAEIQLEAELPDLPRQSDLIRIRIEKTSELSASEKEQVYALLESLPQKNYVCHNDFHPDNIIQTDEGFVVIDWMDAGIGNPAADMARTQLMMLIGDPPDTNVIMRWIINRVRSAMYRSYRKEYIRITGVDEEELALWHAVVAAARFSDNFKKEYPFLKKAVSGGLKKAALLKNENSGT